MFVEFRNVDQNLFYYLTGTRDDPKTLVWSPDVKEHLLSLDVEQTVGQLREFLHPVIKSLTKDNADCWEVKVFKFNEKAVHSLTVNNSVNVYGNWRVGEPTFVDGVELPTRFISL